MTKNYKMTPWCQTYTGVLFYPLEPDAEDICIEDIAHHLAIINRFGGASRVPISVADHSVLVAGEMPAHLALWGLLHDASEAYLIDLPRPVKYSPELVGYRKVEAMLQAMIYAKFGLTGPEPAELKLVDDQMLMTEQRDLMGPQTEPWACQAQPYTSIVYPLSWQSAESVFLFWMRRLTNGSAHGHAR
jgi:hypothetical protein